MADKFWVATIVAVISFWRYSGNYWISTWHSKWFVLLLMLSLAWAWSLKKRWGSFVAAASFSVLYNGLLIFAWHDPIYRGDGELMMVSTGRGAAIACVSFFLLTTFFDRLSLSGLWVLEKALALSCLATGAVSFIQLGAGIPTYERGGLLGNASMNGCYIAATLPLWLAFSQKITQKPGFLIVSLGIPLWGIAVTGASLPLVVLAAVSLYWSGRVYQGRFRDWGFWAAGGLLIAGALGSWFIPDFGGDSGRVGLWRLMAEWFVNTFGVAGFYRGAGPGLTATVLPLLQRKASPEVSDFWLWLHNDWLQVVLEQGVLSGLLTVGVLITALKKSLPRFGASLFGFGVMALANYPVHLPLPAFAFMGVTCLCLESKKLARFEGLF